LHLSSKINKRPENKSYSVNYCTYDLLPDALTTHPVKSERFLMYAIIIFEMLN